MESLERLQTISILSANIEELGELVVELRDDPILRGQLISRIYAQTLLIRILTDSL